MSRGWWEGENTRARGDGFNYFKIFFRSNKRATGDEAENLLPRTFTDVLLKEKLN